jgi:hypothetical protein
MNLSTSRTHNASRTPKGQHGRSKTHHFRTMITGLTARLRAQLCDSHREQNKDHGLSEDIPVEPRGCPPVSGAREIMAMTDRHGERKEPSIPTSRATERAEQSRAELEASSSMSVVHAVGKLQSDEGACVPSHLHFSGCLGPVAMYAHFVCVQNQEQGQASRSFLSRRGEIPDLSRTNINQC